jgi:hypothetical protein
MTHIRNLAYIACGLADIAVISWIVDLLMKVVW